MDINDLFDGIMKSINQFADEIAEQRLQKKMQDNGLERSEQTVREPQASPEGMPPRQRGTNPSYPGCRPRPCGLSLCDQPSAVQIFAILANLSLSPAHQGAGCAD